MKIIVCIKQVPDTEARIRIDEAGTGIAENDINFVRLLKSEFPDMDISNETVNDYSAILQDQRIRNLLAIKLRMTIDVIEDRQALQKEIADLQKLIQKELNKKT